MALRVLLISYYFPPSNAIGTLRTGKTAKYLATLGHDVRVLTAADQDALEQTLPVELERDRISVVRWRTADRLVGWLLARRRAALASGHVPQGAASSVVSRAGRLFRTLVHFPDEAALGLPRAYLAAARLVGAWRPDVILASASPYSALILAAALSRRYDIPWVGELRDLWTDNQLYPYPEARRRVEALLERRVLQSAAGLVTVSEPLAEKLRARHGRPTAVVLNGFDPQDYVDNIRPRAGLPLQIVYTGQVVAGKQDVTPLVEAVHRLGAAARDVRVTFFGRFLGLALQDAMRRAAELRVSDSFVIERSVPHHVALRHQREADALLLLTWNDRANPGVYTGKVFEYAGARRPILAIGNVPTVADDLIRERALGVSRSSPSAIADQLNHWLELKRGVGGVPAVPAHNAAGLTRAEQTRVLADFLERVTGFAEARPASRKNSGTLPSSA